MAFIAFRVDGQPLTEPQTIPPSLLHTLEIEISISHWPAHADRLILDVVTVEPNGTYALPTFTISKPAGAPPYHLKESGRIALNVGQTLISRPLLFTYRARFEPDPKGVDVSVQGQRRLHLQAFDGRLAPHSGYELVDQTLVRIRDSLRRQPLVSDRDLERFLPLLSAIGRIAAQSLQDNLFPGMWSEAEFQSRMRELFRSDPHIGSALEEHPAAAGGITDLSYQGIRLELKAEDTKAISISDAERYYQQPTQYAAGSDRRFAALCVLDCSPKDAAPGPVTNDIAIIEMRSQPTAEGLPILLGVVVVRGNLPTPSALSRAAPRAKKKPRKERRANLRRAKRGQRGP